MSTSIARPFTVSLATVNHHGIATLGGSTDRACDGLNYQCSLQIGLRRLSTANGMSKIIDRSMVYAAVIFVGRQSTRLVYQSSHRPENIGDSRRVPASFEAAARHAHR
ncbi:MAG: hypothetical protein R2867_09015 [Caldilineaceae bacterium]